jgi:hypothetical protein
MKLGSGIQQIGSGVVVGGEHLRLFLLGLFLQAWDVLASHFQLSVLAGVLP